MLQFPTSPAMRQGESAEGHFRNQQQSIRPYAPHSLPPSIKNPPAHHPRTSGRADGFLHFALYLGLYRLRYTVNQ